MGRIQELRTELYGNPAEKAGAVGDLLDIAVGMSFGIVSAHGLTQAIKSFTTSSGKYITKAELDALNRYLVQAELVTLSEVVQGILDNFDKINSFRENTGQLAE